MTYCMACGTALPAGARFCSSCGRTTPAVPPPPPPAPPPPSSGPQATAFYPPSTTVNVYGTPAAPRVSQGVAIVALLLNLLLWPGLGSLIAGRHVGWAQGFLMLFGVILAFVLIGIPIMIAAWIWGIVTGVQLLSEAGQQAPPR